MSAFQLKNDIFSLYFDFFPLDVRDKSNKTPLYYDKLIQLIILLNAKSIQSK
jgi:hypothetical protein